MTASRDVLRQLNDAVPPNATSQMGWVSGPYVSEYENPAVRRLGRELGVPVGKPADNMVVYWFPVREGTALAQDSLDGIEEFFHSVLDRSKEVYATLGRYKWSSDWPASRFRVLRWDTPYEPHVFISAIVLGEVAPVKDLSFPVMYRPLDKRWNLDAGNFKYRKLKSVVLRGKHDHLS